MRTALVVLLLALLPGVAAAQDRETLGVGRLFSNDYLGDGRDRWRSGSYALSILRGPAGGEGWRQADPGSIREWRLRTEIIAPRSLSGDGPDDRPYVGAVSIGLHAHYGARGGEVTAGADAVVVGPQSGVGQLQEWSHEWLSSPRPDVLDDQIGNDVIASGTLAYARPLRVAPTVTLRPFAEALAGPEDIVRFGGDVILGRANHDALWIRDVPSGQLYQGIEDATPGLSVVAGADWSAVGRSRWLPDGDGFEARDERVRARIGIHWQMAPETAFFYGLAYLSPEFEAQDEGQVTGQLKLNFNF